MFLHKQIYANCILKNIKCSFPGKYCGLGLRMDSLIKSKSNEVTVQFMSGIHLFGHGFLASYSTTDKAGIDHILT